jgi:hypothetical protein
MSANCTLLGNDLGLRKDSFSGSGYLKWSHIAALVAYNRVSLNVCADVPQMVCLVPLGYYFYPHRHLPRTIAHHYKSDDTHTQHTAPDVLLQAASVVYESLHVWPPCGLSLRAAIVL